ncbi:MULTISPECIES: ABC transporter permease [Kribbella]|uniref:Peptide/nickel transport system permease protein n=1 Tax=Kribbella pratensis TaxID=2512112 RepID=A0ABY2FN78_9ACTN|nr:MULTISPECIES: ABC transporter permease [Kribbella]TDW94593.1 peptide/nickel transport system permease protein [Kribbella pratensis]TDX03183.1 peptide/nickel transport system permease protein [Kribbella sp. VKM Ac-2566]
MTEATIPVTSIGTTGVSRFAGILSSLRRSPAGFIGFVVVLLLVLVSAIGPFFAPDIAPNVKEILLPAGSPGHLLGTDNEGKDVLAQMIGGGRTVIFVGFFAAAISTAIAIVLGSLAAYLGGWVDSAVVTVADVFLTVPPIILLAVLGAFFKLDSPILLALLVGVLSWPVLTRAVRAQVLSLKEREFVEAARLLDLGTVRVVFVEILPNMASFILMNFMIGVTNAIYQLVGFYLLGLAPLSGANWGIMLNRAWIAGAIFNDASLAWILSPIVAIILLQLGLVMMTRSLEEILNPRLRDR